MQLKPSSIGSLYWGKYAIPDYNYVIGPGDTMEIFVWGNEELNQRPLCARMVSLPPAWLKTSRQWQNLNPVGSGYRESLRGIRTAACRQCHRQRLCGCSDQQVRVVGEAANPTSIPYRQYMTLLDLMIAVGGMTEFAAGNDSVCADRGRPAKSYGVRLDDLLKDGDISANLTMQPGDILIIESWF